MTATRPRRRRGGTIRHAAPTGGAAWWSDGQDRREEVGFDRAARADLERPDGPNRRSAQRKRYRRFRAGKRDDGASRHEEATRRHTRLRVSRVAGSVVAGVMRHHGHAGRRPCRGERRSHPYRRGAEKRQHRQKNGQPLEHRRPHVCGTRLMLHGCKHGRRPRHHRTALVRAPRPVLAVTRSFRGRRSARRLGDGKRFNRCGPRRSRSIGTWRTSGTRPPRCGRARRERAMQPRGPRDSERPAGIHSTRRHRPPPVQSPNPAIPSSEESLSPTSVTPSSAGGRTSGPPRPNSSSSASSIPSSASSRPAPRGAAT